MKAYVSNVYIRSRKIQERNFGDPGENDLVGAGKPLTETRIVPEKWQREKSGTF
jgi:hypothetical protein